MDQFAHLDATAQAELVRKGEVKPIELVDAAIERIERVNPQLNAVVTPMFEIAREVAKGDLPDGPFKGVPFLIKDLLASYKGLRITDGSVFMRDFVAPFDSELVTRLKRAGLVIVGKTNTPEFGILPTTEPKLFGATRNPWDITRTTGGSSGGSAAAVAAGMVPMAHANDGGGSIRIPASCCGLFGLKPTRGRNSLAPEFGDMFGGLVCEHAVTRSVRDSAALLDATAGVCPGDPYIAPVPARPFLQEVGAKTGSLKIAFSVKSFNGAEVHEDCIKAVRDAAALCAELGHEVVEKDMAFDGEAYHSAFIALWSAGVSWIVEKGARETGREPSPEVLEPLTWALYEMGKTTTAVDYMMGINLMQKFSREVAREFIDFDLWLTPTLGEPPLPLGSFDAQEDNPLFGLFRAAMFCPFTPLFNITGQPAMSVPLYWNSEGLPVGSHFIGRYGDEATLFRLAAQLEEARPWANRRPPVSAWAREE